MKLSYERDEHGLSLDGPFSLEGVWFDPSEWINHDWFPRMLAVGWKYWALLEPETAIGAMTMKKF